MLERRIVEDYDAEENTVGECGTEREEYTVMWRNRLCTDAEGTYCVGKDCASRLKIRIEEEKTAGEH